MFKDRLRICISSFNSLLAQREDNLKTVEREARRPAGKAGLFADLVKPGLVRAYRQRYSIAKHGAWWETEGQKLRRVP